MNSVIQGLYAIIGIVIPVTEDNMDPRSDYDTGKTTEFSLLFYFFIQKQRQNKQCGAQMILIRVNRDFYFPAIYLHYITIVPLFN